GTDHFDATNFAIGDLEGFGDFEARRSVKNIPHRDSLAVGELDRVHGAVLIEDDVGPDDAALFVNQRKAAIANAGDDGVIAALELSHAAHAEGVEGGVGRERGIVGGMDTVFHAVAIVGEGIDALAVVIFQAGEIHVGGVDQLRARDAFGWRNRFEPDGLGRELVVALKVGGTTAALAVIGGLDFGDSAALDAEAHAHDDEVIAFVHGDHAADLLEDGIGKAMLVAADLCDRTPEAVANFHYLIVFGVFHIFR